MRVLIAYDGSEESERALTVVGSLPVSWCGLLSVVPTVSSGGRGGALNPMDGVEEHRVEIARAAERLNLGGPTEPMVAVGDPGHAICEIAGEQDADLIIIGSRDRRGLKKLLLGSVSLYVTAHAPCDVLVLR